MRQTPVPLSQAIIETAKELAIAGEALAHPESASDLTPPQRQWLALVRRSYDAGKVKVVYSITRSENGSISVAFPPSNVGLGFGVSRQTSNIIEVEFPRRQ